MKWIGEFSRRHFLRAAGLTSAAAFVQSLFPEFVYGQIIDSSNQRANEIDITIGELDVEFDGKKGKAVAMNGKIPGPVFQFTEGEEAVIRVTNRLNETTSIHWHGLILPEPMDGVPGVSFAGIRPGETFTYRFPIVQSGTYWCHSHSGGQEQLGVYAPFIIKPKHADPIRSNREYVILLSDFSFMHPMTIISKLKKDNGYFNYQKRTVGDFFRDVKTKGFGEAFSERAQWLKMRMDPTDILDVTGASYVYLMNGHTEKMNWSGLFKSGEKIRLRFINGAAMTIFDVRIPGLQMSVVQADGQNIEPVSVHEFRFAPGETYDVIVEPRDEKPYAIFAETLDRSGYAIGTLTPKHGLIASRPARRSRPERTMMDMGMSMGAMPGMGGSMDMPGMSGTKKPLDEKEGKSRVSEAHSSMKGMDDMGGMDMSGMEMPDMKMPRDSKKTSSIPGKNPVKHGSDHHGVGNSMVPEETKSRLDEPGTGLGSDERRVLVYTDLKNKTRNVDLRNPEREIELHLTGNMDRYMWSIDGKKYSDAPEPIVFYYGERVRLTLVNDTMMEHPMHLHGMFMDLENGSGEYLPRKHTVIVKPAERVSLAITADALGDWAFHCHMLYHMELGMFRVVRVIKKPKDKPS